jgi:hypothetical protein
VDIDNAQRLLTDHQIPDRGALTSFASHPPPGVSWLVLPGTIQFRDPRLFEFAGTSILYVATLIGIFLLARSCFGAPCAVLAVVLFGFSEIGIAQAASLWARFPLPCFVVWTAYWTVQWVTRRNARYLAAALVTWAAGMYVYLEIAPAFFMSPGSFIVLRYVFDR